MSRSVQKRIAVALAAAGGLVVLLTAGLLTVEVVVARCVQPRDQARVDELLEKVQTDAACSATLHAEYERQTEASLQRQARSDRYSTILLAAAIGFLLCWKWFLALGGPQTRLPRSLVALQADCVAETAPPAPDVSASAPERLPVVDDVDLAAVDEIVADIGRGSEAAIPILQAIQSRYRYLPDAALRRVCELTEITPAQLTSVATFYDQFRRTPIGEHLVTVCCGTACHVAGAARLTDELRRQLHIAPGEDTDPRQKFTVREVPCLGCCTLAPVVQLDGVTHGHTRPDALAPLLHECVAATNDGSVKRPPRVPRGDGRPPAGAIRVGLGSCCIASGSGRVHAALEEALAAAGVNAVVKRVGCVGMCHQTPLVEVSRPGQPSALYSRVEPGHARAIVRRHFKADGLARRLGNTFLATVDHLRDPAVRRAAAQRAIELRDPPIAAFWGRQKRIATEHCGDLDPLDLDEYLARDGFKALHRCVHEQVDPEKIIAQIKASGLRGRGGAGYPTWLKWNQVRAAAGETKYIICNGDEGDPGAFMDRMLMESYPYRIIEGLAIAACATGATEGYFYTRAEYTLALERITEALRRCEERGLLDDDVPGTGRRLRLRVVRGAGAFVCGEETSLIASLEGRRGLPSLRPPYPAQRGLHGRPTLVSNVETCAVVPWIMRNGPEAFAALGTDTSKGTKVFALTGKVRRGGLIEVPMGITVREIVEDIGGGIKSEETPVGPRPHTFKAVQIGGPSGGCVPAELGDTPVDYEALAEVGAMMGSGGLVVLDETDCMVDIARYFLAFTQDQSCGKCAPCRIGTRRMLEILERLCNGQGRPDDLETLEELARVVVKGSLCGLGKTAPNPVLTTLRYFRSEYVAHLEGRCPAGKCKALITYSVSEACTGCTLCAQHCPAGAIALRPYERHEIDPDKCTRCDTCRSWCPEDAIEVT